MMTLIDSNGNVLLEREKPHSDASGKSTVRIRKMPQGVKKTVKPQLMSKEEFVNNILKTPNNGNI